MHPTSLQKARQDGENLYRYARAVIVIDEHGSVIEVINRVQGSLINVLAVLGPVKLPGNHHIARSVRAEIGFGRVTPYKQVETPLLGGRSAFKRRIVHSPLSHKDQVALFPVMCHVIQKVIDEEVMHRKNLTYFKNKKENSPVYSNGKWITVPPDLTLLMYACLAKDLQTRLRGHIAELVMRTKINFNKLPYAVYPEKKFRRLKVAKFVASVFADASYGGYLLEIIKKKMGRLGTKHRALFEQVLEVFKIKPDPTKDLEYLRLREIFGNKEKEILRGFPLDVMTQGKRVERREIKYGKPPKYRHAENCLRLEVRPSQAAIKRHAMIKEHNYRAAEPAERKLA